jgi:hypothetical protein
LWELDQFERVVHLDADMIVLKNIDELLDDAGGALPPCRIRAVHECFCAVKRGDEPCAHRGCGSPATPHGASYFNSGLMVLQPCRAVLAHMLAALAAYDFSTCRFGDQDFLNVYYRGAWDALPWTFNATKTLYACHREGINGCLEGRWELPAVRIVHFTMAKPWDLKHPLHKGFERLNTLWWAAFAEPHTLPRMLLKVHLQEKRARREESARAVAEEVGGSGGASFFEYASRTHEERRAHEERESRAMGDAYAALSADSGGQALRDDAARLLREHAVSAGGCSACAAPARQLEHSCCGVALGGAPLLTVEGVLAPAECDAVVAAIRRAVQARGGWETERHSRHRTTDLHVSDVAAVEEMVRSRVFERILRPHGARFVAPFLPEHLRFNDLFYVRYGAAPGEQRALETHADGSLFSFNVLLNSGAAFEGGGTYFEACGRTVRPAQGAAVVHSGRTRHAGVATTSGERFLLVGFVGVEARPYSPALARWAAHAAFCKFGRAAWSRGGGHSGEATAATVLEPALG